MFRHKHKHPAFKALRDTVAFVVLCAGMVRLPHRRRRSRCGFPHRMANARSLLFLWCLAGLLGRCRPAAVGVRPLQCHGHGLAGKPAPRKRK